MTDEEFRQLFARNQAEIAVRLSMQPLCHGPRERLIVKGVMAITDVFVNTQSGTVEIGDQCAFGHQVMLIAATHDYTKFGAERMKAIPTEGHDIVLEEGVWLATRVTVIGPARIGRHAVVAAGAVVTSDVEPYAIYAGVPAKKVGEIPH
jgi:acetyltransferase-like isoleucine patch superfamily enzyme